MHVIRVVGTLTTLSPFCTAIIFVFANSDFRACSPCGLLWHSTQATARFAGSQHEIPIRRTLSFVTPRLAIAVHVLAVLKELSTGLLAAHLHELRIICALSICSPRLAVALRGDIPLSSGSIWLLCAATTSFLLRLLFCRCRLRLLRLGFFRRFRFFRWRFGLFRCWQAIPVVENPQEGVMKLMGNVLPPEEVEVSVAIDNCLLNVGMLVGITPPLVLIIAWRQLRK